MTGSRDYKPATRAVRGGTQRTPWKETSEMLALTSGYVSDSAEEAAARMAGDLPGFVYSRYNNPTLSMLQQRLAEIEGAESCRVTASGMAAIHAAMMAPCRTGDRVVASRALFGSCGWIVGTLMPRYGIETVFVDGQDMDGWAEALSQPTKLVLLETPSNPLLDAVDISAIAELAKGAGAKLIVDNVFATPVLQRPLELGADWVVYSATKHMDGQGRVLGGVILGPEADLQEDIDLYLKHTGPALSPFNAWVLLKGLETLELRVERHSENAAKVADTIAAHPAIAALRYPGRSDHPHHAIHARQMRSGGGLLALSLKGGGEAAWKCLNGLEMIDISNNLGDAKTLACHPATTTHRALSEEDRAAMGLDDSWIRLSVGLEDVDDILFDLMHSLDRI